MTYASAGFAAVAPDYLGLGVGPGPHPWKDVPSETTASLDMLRAARNFVPSTGRSLRRDVLVTGFSQGASAALGLARALQEGADGYFRIRAVAPISGAYDMANAEIPALLDGELHPKASVVYAALLIVAWDRLHGLYREPGELIQEPYDRTIEELFDGEHRGQEVVAGTPDSISDLLTPRAVEMLRHPTGRLAAALRVDASVCTGWTPAVPIRLYRISDDMEATTANTDHCQAALRDRGVEVPVIDLGTGGHTNSNKLGTAQIVRWFSWLS
jgi:pimeloyl-ACP methyl ester carboxylesterase